MPSTLFARGTSFARSMVPAAVRIGRHTSLCLALTVLAACSSPATIALVSPAEGEVLCGDNIHMEVTVENFELDADSTTALGSVPAGREISHEGEEGGHIHVYLDGVEIYQSGVESFDMAGPWDEGEHQLKVELVNGDHSEVDPYAGDFHTITIDNSTCTG